MSYLVRSAVTALLPGSELGLSEFLTRFRRESTGLMWVGVVSSALLFTVCPLVTVYVPLPAPWLPARLLDRHAAAMADHPVYLVRQATFLLKMVAGLHWGARDEVRARHGLAPYPADPGTWRSS
ncbi:MAG: hypothetical protein ABMA64_28470 [Myxococcota bacterium]